VWEDVAVAGGLPHRVGQPVGVIAVEAFGGLAARPQNASTPSNWVSDRKPGARPARERTTRERRHGAGNRGNTAAGLQLITSFSYVLAEVGKSDFWAPAIESFRRLVPKSGIMTEQEADAWAEGLRLDSVAGVFFGASNYYGYVARRP
jgi:hypothetical protein